MSALEDAKALLPENHQGWDCDGSANVCDERVNAMRALIEEIESRLPKPVLLTEITTVEELDALPDGARVWVGIHDKPHQGSDEFTKGFMHGYGQISLSQPWARADSFPYSHEALLARGPISRGRGC